MDVHGWIALATLVAATTLFVTRLVPLPMSALAIPVVLFSTGTITKVEDALRGFGNLAVVTIASILVIGSALRESGVATLMARTLMRVGGKSETGLVMSLMIATAFLAAFMNNTAVVAILMPVALALSRRSGILPSALLMPLAFAAVLGGTNTLIGTAPNFLVANFFNTSKYAGEDTIEVFDFAAIGIPITLTGVLFMVFVGRRLLPRTQSKDGETSAPSPEEAARIFQMPENLLEMRVAEASRVVGRTIADVDIRRTYDMNVILVRRPGPMGPRWLEPEPGLELQVDDHLYVEGSHEAAWNLAESERLLFGLAQPDSLNHLVARGTTFAEISVPPHSEAIGRTLRELEFRKRFGLNVVALLRRDAPVHSRLGDLELELGDAFLVSGSLARVRDLQAIPDYVVLTDHSLDENVARAPLAIILLLVAVLPPVLFGFPLPISAMASAILMVATRCIAKRAVLRAIDWNVLALIVGTVPLGIALEQHGISRFVATSIGDLAPAGGLTIVFAALFLMAAVLSVMVSNAAAAVIMAPVAAQVGVLVGIEPRSALLAMAYGCSCNFLLPFAQCNLMVMAPGGYRTRDFVRVGFWMSLVMAATTIGVLHLQNST